jgi:hypothetical protein
MIYSIFPKADTTCYEQYPTKNTGLDEILELEKIVSSSTIAGLYNTRILMDFDLYNLSQSLTITPGKFYLNLYIADKNTPETSSIQYGYPEDTGWTSGIGKSTHNPITKDGANWTYSTGTTTWTGGNGPETNSAIVTTRDESIKDIRADLTGLINSTWGISENPGLLIKRTLAQETDGKRYGYLKFFSNDTSTIYRPRLDICYDDHIWSTGSLAALDTTKDYFVYLKNNFETLKIDTTTRFRFEAKEKYPAKVYVTSATSTSNKYFPSSSYYSIVDVKTGEIIIPFDTTYTKISCDATSNYANLTLSGLYPNRRYRFVIRIDGSDDLIKYHNLETTFQVVE